MKVLRLNGRTLIAALAVLLLLGGCHRAAGPAVTPTPTATPTPTPTPEPSAEPKKLWGFPIDDTHDAFLVPTKGALGTVLVTVEMENEAAQELHFSVRTKDDLDKPIQTMTAQRVNVFHRHQEKDINFDGYGDFTYQWMLGKNAGSSTLWLWDEKAQKFVEEPEYANIPNPRADPETQTISGIITYTNAGDGEETFYRWEDGKLVCFRKEERTYPDGKGNREKVIYERVNGELVEISREPLVMLG